MTDRDYAFEALAEVTATDWNEGRGELNAALLSIREQEPEIYDNYLLSVEIYDRAKLYHAVMGEEILLTPSALAKHWRRVVEQAPKPRPINPPISPEALACPSCHGDKMVLVSIRPSTKNPRSGFEEWAPCPSCNSGADAGFWRVDGSRFMPPSAEQTRTRMQP